MFWLLVMPKCGNPIQTLGNVLRHAGHTASSFDVIRKVFLLNEQKRSSAVTFDKFVYWKVTLAMALVHMQWK